LAVATASGISRFRRSRACLDSIEIEAACAVASHLPLRKRRNHTVDIESAHAFDPKYLGTQMTELERAEKLTGESGAPGIQPRHQAHSASGCRTDGQAGGERRTKSAERSRLCATFNINTRLGRD
jgi:hypothetical protein